MFTLIINNNIKDIIIVSTIKLIIKIKILNIIIKIKINTIKIKIDFQTLMHYCCQQTNCELSLIQKLQQLLLTIY